MDVQDVIARGYRALGLGADDDVLAMFGQSGDERADWIVRDLTSFGRQRPAGEVVALELFGALPAQFELIAAEPRTWTWDRRRTSVAVTGYFRVRLREDWDVIMLPFTHVWKISDGRVDTVVSLLDGVELGRRDTLKVRRRRWWWRKAA